MPETYTQTRKSQKATSIRVLRKVKIDGKWVDATVPLDRKGRPHPSLVKWKGKEIRIAGGTFYIAHGHGGSRKKMACGTDPDAVMQALRTQAHVLELRRRGMDVGDAPEIVDSRRLDNDSLRAIALRLKESPPPGYTKKTGKRYVQALTTFADWAAGIGIHNASQVDARTMKRWVSKLKADHLDAATIKQKVGIVVGQLRLNGAELKLEKGTLPTIVTREREIYTHDELKALFRSCTVSEYELFQTFLVTGFRKQEVAFLGPGDFDAVRSVVKVTAKKDLGFTPKTFEERSVPVSRSYLEMMRPRIERAVENGEVLVFHTARTNRGRKNEQGGRADMKMLEKLKQLAHREGLNCGSCRVIERGKAVTCRNAPLCQLWGLHKFRHTFATMMLRDGVDIKTLSVWLGHKDIATTMIYVRALQAELSQPQVERSTIARKFGGPVPKSAEGRVRVASPRHG